MIPFAARSLIACLALAGAAHAAPPSSSSHETTRAAPTMRQNPPAAAPVIPPANEARVLRARANLVALRQGTLAVSSLSAQDMQDVLDLDRLARGEGADSRSFSQQCLDREMRRAGGRPSQLAQQIMRLKCR
jgi:hypothetical protein